MKETAIYIHIPFCDHKCIYCDFYSIVSYENTQSYLDSLFKEIETQSLEFSADRKITSIFLGGGTPSFMEPEYIGRILEQVKTKFRVDEKAEITMETNPGTVSKEKLIDFKNTGINRISIGIQSFDKKELGFLTRIHDAETAIKTVRDAADIFENISIDLIFTLPNQTKEIWMRNLTTAVSLPIKHISAYSLILEHGTILNKMVLDGKVKMQDEDYDAELYELTIEYLSTKGFDQYEVSNFTKPGFECIHNLAYWRYKDYLGFGSSAHSFVSNKRWWNFSSVKFYNDAVNKKSNAAAGYEILKREQMIVEYVMLALRSNGLDLRELENRFGSEWIEMNKNYLDELIKDGYLIQQNSVLKFTATGYALCDEIISKFNL